MSSVVNVWRVDLELLDKFFEQEGETSGGNPALFQGQDGQALLQRLRESFFCAQIRSQVQFDSQTIMIIKPNIRSS